MRGLFYGVLAVTVLTSGNVVVAAEKMKEIMPPAHRHGPSATEQPKDESVTPPPPPSETSSTSSSSSAKTSKKGKAKHKKHHNGAAVSANAETPEQVRDPVDPTKARFLREIKYTEMLRSLMRAYFQLFNALEREGLVQVKPPMYSTPTIRFQRRFAAFQKLHYPAALTYEDFSQNSDFSPYELELIYKSAEECFKVARAHAEALLNDEEGINTIVTDAGAGLVRGFELQSLLKQGEEDVDAVLSGRQEPDGVRLLHPPALPRGGVPHPVTGCHRPERTDAVDRIQVGSGWFDVGFRG
ncbi:hypothetical protein ON010_g6374 [Phytophthora cinnamomi]|nr:hypothetical protein ON010_g6374 [Phytophthora cinnamomi]